MTERNKPISVGDLVMVVQTCCTKSVAYYGVSFGLPWRVEGIARIEARCPWCKAEYTGLFAQRAKTSKGWDRAPMHWLKRLDPDSLKDDVPTKEELTA